MSSISRTAKRIFFVVFVFVIILATLISTLSNGIKVDNFGTKLFQIEKLYIKLDKKLILRVANLRIHKEKSDVNSVDSSEFTRKIWLLNKLFREINIQNISYENANFSLFYNGERFFVNSPEIYLNSNLEGDNGYLNLDVETLNLKDFNLSLKGKAKIDLKRAFYDFNGTFENYELSGNIKGSLNKNILDFNLSDARAMSLEKLVANLDEKYISKDVKEWIYGKIIAQNYAISEVSGKIDLNKKFNPNSLYGLAAAKNLDVKFDENLSAVKIPLAIITLKNDVLDFELNEPSYEKIALNGSKVSISNLISDGAKLKLYLRANSVLDEKIKRILRAYDIDFPVIQTSGKLASDLNLQIDLNNLDVVANGKFDLKNTTLKIGDANFLSNSANIALHGDKVIFQNANLQNDLFSANLNGALDLKNDTGEFTAQFDKICIGSCEVLDIKDEKHDVFVDFKKDFILEIPDFTLLANLGENSIFSLQNLSMLKSRSKLMDELGIKNSELKIAINDDNSISAKAKNCEFNFGLSEISGSPYQKDDFLVNISPNADIIDVSSASGKIDAKVTNSAINVNFKNVQIALDTNASDSKYEKRINFSGLNSSLYFTDLNRTFALNDFEGYVNSDKIGFSGHSQKGNINLVKTRNSVAINGSNLSDKLVNSALGLEAFKQGKFDLRLAGRDFRNFKAEIKAKNTFLADYKFQQNFLAFLDTIPSLLVFKVPDFNDNGFSVEEGKTFIQRKGDLLSMDAAEFKGSSADIVAKGFINLANKGINIDFELKILKGASSLIGKIPLVSQILLGKDGTISTAFEARGTTENPEFTTHVMTDILKTPFNLIKNILELPFNLFD